MGVSGGALGPLWKGPSSAACPLPNLYFSSEALVATLPPSQFVLN